MEKLEKTFKKYLDIRVGSYIRAKIEDVRKRDAGFNAILNTALAKTFAFHADKKFDEQSRDAMFNAQTKAKKELRVIGLEENQVERVVSAMTFAAAEIA